MKSPIKSLASIGASFVNQQQQQQQAIGTTSGALSNAAASVMNTGQTPDATGTISGALTGATTNAGMLSGVNTQSGGDVEGRITALEQNAPSNTLGNATPVFNPQAQQAAQGIFGTQKTMQNSVGAPFMFEDQTGDGKITQADVITARTEGYKK